MKWVTIINTLWNFQESFVEREFKKKGLLPKITFRSELPSALVNVVLNSDAMFPCSEFLNDPDDKLRKIELKGLSVSTAFPIFSYSHKQLQQSKQHLWLSEHIKALLK